jgi:nucleotide-binding universal stress UspA family protein
MRVLVATDGSRQAGAAVRFAAWLVAGFPGARLEVMLVGDVGTELVGQGGGAAERVWSAMDEEYRRWALRSLDRAAREALRFSVKARCHYVEASLAPIAAVISRAADRLGADLIVVGSAGRGAVGRAVFGSVARRLTHTARRPVVVVPAPVPVRRGDPLRILAATDGSRGAMVAVRAAARLARRARRGRLEVVTVGTLRRDLALGFSAVVLSMVPYPELQASERREARAILRKAARATGGTPARLRFLEPRSSRPPADLLAGEARRKGAHLIVVGTEGHGAVGGWMVGSLTARLLAKSRRPVMVVRPPGKRG